MKEKTVKQLADSLGISKTAIFKRFRKNDNLKRKHTHKNGNKLLIDANGQKMIKESFFKPKQKPVSEPNRNSFSVSVSDLLKKNNAILEKNNQDLKKQLAIKDHQLAEANNRLKEVNKLSDQEQQLHLADQKRIQQLTQISHKSNKAKPKIDKYWWQFWK